MNAERKEPIVAPNKAPLLISQYHRSQDYWVVTVRHHRHLWLKLVIRTTSEEGARSICTVLDLWATSWDRREEG